MTTTANPPADQLTAGSRDGAARRHDAPVIRPVTPPVTAGVTRFVTPVMTPPAPVVTGRRDARHDGRHDGGDGRRHDRHDGGRDASRDVPRDGVADTPAVTPRAEVAAAGAPAAKAAGGKAKNGKPEKVAGALWYYLCALACTALSLNTSWLFFSHVWIIPTAYGERYVIFGVMELFGFAFARDMRAKVKAGNRPGPARVGVIVLCAASAYMALSVSPGMLAVGRVAGPVGAIVALHYAMGVHRAARQAGKASVWQRVRRHVTQWFLARFGIVVEEDQDDAQIRRDWAVRRAAALATAPLPRTARGQVRRDRKLDKQLHIADVAQRPGMEEKLRREIAVRRNRSDLYAYTPASPWAQPDSPAPAASQPAPPAQPQGTSRHQRRRPGKRDRRAAAATATKTIVTAPVPPTGDPAPADNVRPIGTITPAVRDCMDYVRRWMTDHDTTEVPSVADMDQGRLGREFSHGTASAARKHLLTDPAAERTA